MAAASSRELALVLGFMHRRDLKFAVLSFGNTIAIGNQRYGTAIELPRTQRFEKLFPLGATVTAFMWEDRDQLGLTSSWGTTVHHVPMATIEQALLF